LCGAATQKSRTDFAEKKNGLKNIPQAAVLYSEIW
jgi:hypothetical protein